MTLLGTFAERLRGALLAHPMRVQSVICGGCYTLGDFTAQSLEKVYSLQSPGKTGYNYSRTMRMGVFGLFFGGPVIFTWYKHLWRMTSVFRYKYVPVQTSAASSSWISSFVQGSYRRECLLDNTTSTVRNLMVRVMFDQLFFNAAFLNGYLCVISLLEGRTFDEAYSRMQRDFHDQWAYMAVFWVPVQCVNFTLIPAQFNGIFVMVMNVGWTTLLSMLNHSRDYGSATGTDSTIQHTKSDDPLAENDDVQQDALARRESEFKLQALRHRLVERRSQIIDQLRELEAQRCQIDEVLVLTDERYLREQRHRIQHVLSLSESRTTDVDNFLKLVGRDEMCSSAVDDIRGNAAEFFSNLLKADPALEKPTDTSAPVAL